MYLEILLNMVVIVDGLLILEVTKWSLILFLVNDLKTVKAFTVKNESF